MKPIEKMAAAYISAGISPKYWDELSPQNQLAIAACMRAALLALAEVELPESIPVRGFGSWQNSQHHEHFRAILRHLAEESGGRSP
jgi:hypothetical protein